jgi:hypothetical protein
VPREFQQACLHELMTRGQELWLGSYTEAIKAMTDIACGRGPVGQLATPGERLRAAQAVVERIEGKVPERLMVSGDKPWQTVLDGIVAEVSDDQVNAGRARIEGGMVVEGEFELSEDDDDEPPQPSRSRRRRRSQ